MNSVFSKQFSQLKNEILDIIKNFKNSGTLIGPGARNVVKFFEIDGNKYNFKSFTQHNFINRHVYKYYRKSKARRSYEYANILLSKGYYTPNPIAYIEFFDFWGLTSSYYVSEQLDNCFPLSDALFNPQFSDRENIFKAYTDLIYNLHESGIEFIDNASGNFLIKKCDGNYKFYLVDLNRINFHENFPLEKRFKNFARLTTSPEIIKIIADEYASLSGNASDFCYKKIVETTSQKARKNKIKKILKFYKYFLKK